jgi:glycosyltransferase involved in cell wall biosynthesis
VPLRVLSAILFYPRGGSAHAARALARGLRERGATVTLLAGSRSGLGGHADARRFYGTDVHPVDFDAALASPHPLDFASAPGGAPMHPSFEDRPDAPDVVFASLDDTRFERQVAAWARELERAGAREHDVAHLHHLTPLNEAMARVAPEVPIVGQLHGTELLMLEHIASGPPPGWTHAERWAGRLRAWAHRCERLLVPPSSVGRAADILELHEDRLEPLPSGVDLDVFAPRQIDRARFWHEVLVREPQGWLPGHDAGSVGYHAADVDALAGASVLLCVGRFTAVKRLPMLVEAFGTARADAESRSALVFVGGHPGEWEGEHPAESAERLGAEDVYLAGWHEHERLPDFFAAADAVVTTSEREQFGLVLVEGMACGLPVVATRSPGPAMIVEDGTTGWLVEPDDSDGLVAALRRVIDDEPERRRRGERALEVARERFSWDGVAARLEEVLAEAAEGTRHSAAVT